MKEFNEYQIRSSVRFAHRPASRFPRVVGVILAVGVVVVAVGVYIASKT